MCVCVCESVCVCVCKYLKSWPLCAAQQGHLHA